MAVKTFQCRLITPEAQVLDEPVEQVIVPAWDGLFGVLADRAPVVARLGMGELRLDFADGAKGKGGARSFFVDGGFVQMVGNRLTVLAAHAKAVEEITESDAKAELGEAAARRTEGLSSTEQDRLRHQKQRAEQKLATVKAVRARGGI